MATLTIQLAGFPAVSHLLKDDTITIGRMKGNNIVIDDDSVSLTHARITRINGELYLKDLNWTNGTIVNGQRINEARLRDQDRVFFANVGGQFQLERAAALAQPAVNAATAPAPMSRPAPLPIGASAPAPAFSAAPIPAPALAAAPQPASRPEPVFLSLFSTFNFVRFIPWLSGALGLAMAALFGWKMLHGSQANQSSAVAASAPPVNSSPARKIIADNVPATLVSKPISESVPVSHPAPRAESKTPSIAQLAQGLKDPDPAERRRAATALHSLGTEAKEAAPALHEALQDTDQDVRMWAALTLVNNELHDKATVPILIGVLQRDNPVLRQVACLSLGLISYDESEKETVVPALTETASKDGDDEVRKAAVSALNIIAPDALAKVSVR